MKITSLSVSDALALTMGRPARPLKWKECPPAPLDSLVYDLPDGAVMILGFDEQKRELFIFVQDATGDATIEHTFSHTGTFIQG